jgi:hypothetical protein
MVVALVAVLLLLEPTAFGRLNRKRNGVSGQNVRLSTHQDRPDVGGVGVERENSVHKIETSIFFRDRLALHVHVPNATLTEGRAEQAVEAIQQ